MDRLEADRRIREILEGSPRLWDWPDMRDTLAVQLMTVVDEAVEAVLDGEDEDDETLTTLSDPKNVDLREVR